MRILPDYWSLDSNFCQIFHFIISVLQLCRFFLPLPALHRLQGVRTGELEAKRQKYVNFLDFISFSQKKI